MLHLSEEFERHAAECRDMAMSAYEPAFRAALVRLAHRLELRAQDYEHAELRSHLPAVHATAARPHVSR